MQKKLFEFKTKTIVATGLGAALFTLLFMYVKVPTGIPETEIQTAYGIGAFFGALFGPIAGGSSLLSAMRCLIRCSTVPHGGAG
jgi:energy-coupling factor transport system substrate-specific component